MSGNLNHMICPSCGHDFYVDAAYGTCDACQRVFYANQSRTVTLRDGFPLPRPGNIVMHQAEKARTNSDTSGAEK